MIPIKIIKQTIEELNEEYRQLEEARNKTRQKIDDLRQILFKNAYEEIIGIPFRLNHSDIFDDIKTVEFCVITGINTQQLNNQSVKYFPIGIKISGIFPKKKPLKLQHFIIRKIDYNYNFITEIICITTKDFRVKKRYTKITVKDFNLLLQKCTEHIPLPDVITAVKKEMTEKNGR